MNKAVYKHLLGTYGRNPAIWIGLAASLVQTFVIRVYTVIIMAQVATDIAAGDVETAKRHTLLYLVVYIIGAFIGTFGELLSIKTENKQYEKLMASFHKKLTNKDMSFYRDNQTGYLATAFRQYLDGSMLLVRFWRGEALGTVVSLTAPVLVMFIVSPKIGLTAALVVFVQMLYIVWSSAKANQYRYRSHEVYRKTTGEVSDEITNIVAFKSSGVEDEAQTRLLGLAKEETTVYWLRRKTVALLDLPRSIMTALGTAAVIYLIIASLESKNPASLGMVVLTLTYMFQIVRNVASLPNLVANHDDLVTKLHPMLAYLTDEHENILDPQTPKRFKPGRAKIDFNRVSFSYPSQNGSSEPISVFKDLSIHIAAGERVGIVGLSGAGKSTLASLLLRFDEVTSGSITINDVDIRELEQSYLRRNIAYVPQEPLLFHRTIRENIAYYNDRTNDAEIVRVAKAAHADDFIRDMPDGYDTLVGERGIKLSGGQKQRVAIARALLKKAPIVLFDEATSALDSESEQIIQQALPEILGKQTAIVIAHRLSTVASLDRIIVLQAGKIVEEGNHGELLEQKGQYYALWQRQTVHSKMR